MTPSRQSKKTDVLSMVERIEKDVESGKDRELACLRDGPVGGVLRATRLYTISTHLAGRAVASHLVHTRGLAPSRRRWDSGRLDSSPGSFRARTPDPPAARR